jgi:hypothetical protein
MDKPGSGLEKKEKKIFSGQLCFAFENAICI